MTYGNCICFPGTDMWSLRATPWPSAPSRTLEIRGGAQRDLKTQTTRGTSDGLDRRPSTSPLSPSPPHPGRPPLYPVSINLNTNPYPQSVPQTYFPSNTVTSVSCVAEVYLNLCVCVPVNSIDCETMPMNEEKKTLEERTQSGPRPILPYSSMFVFGQANV